MLPRNGKIRTIPKHASETLVHSWNGSRLDGQPTDSGLDIDISMPIDTPPNGPVAVRYDAASQSRAGDPSLPLSASTITRLRPPIPEICIIA